VVRTARRDALAGSLRDQGIETRVYYPVPLHMQECFGHLGPPPSLETSETTALTALALPLFPWHDPRAARRRHQRDPHLPREVAPHSAGAPRISIVPIDPCVRVGGFWGERPRSPRARVGAPSHPKR
jgi:hypothetical protein